MKEKKQFGLIIGLVSLLFFVLFVFFTNPSFAKEDKWENHQDGWNAVKPEKFVVEHPTLICLGFEWYIQGDENHNATVNVWYREKGDARWKEAMPLLRIQNEECINSFSVNWIDYITPNLFAGSIMDLEPDTEYICKFVMSDPDGIQGKAKKMVAVRTRPEPQPYEGGNVYHVYPWDYDGPKEEPNFVNLMLAYYAGGGCTADWWNLAPPRVQPGDTILVHAGEYKEDWTFYGADLWGHGQGAKFSGTYFLTQSGTADKPIVIKAAGDGEVIFDGNGNFNLFNLMAADYHYFEGLTVRNTDVAFWVGQKRIIGSNGLTVKNCRIENVDKGVHCEWSGSKDFYIADNIFIGRHDQNQIHGWTNPYGGGFYPYEKCLSEYAIKLAGEGHVICHNYVAHFHNGICHATYGVPEGYPAYGHPDIYPVKEVLVQDSMFRANDMYNNFIQNIHDNAIEADGTMYNIRVLRNFCMDGAAQALSSQTLYGGPAYFIRNIIYHGPSGGFVKHQSNPSGSLYFHNTATARVSAGSGSNYHFRNNLILDWIPDQTIFSVDTFTNYTTSDYNGFFADPDAAYSFGWNSPPFDILKDYANPREVRRYATLEEYSEATGQDEHSILIDYGIFGDVTPPDPNDRSKIYDADLLNFELKPESAAVDAGCILPNINDDFTGEAPDLGALEVGKPLPIYGPRY
ncbi:MAG: hypothetical protein JW932_17560 [Deltaproteobacteria bacterium]|nr:hypothetical protein [Deltaproteobacteria bacterium]